MRRTWRDVKEQQMQDDQNSAAASKATGTEAAPQSTQSAAGEQKPREVVITGIKDGVLIGKEPEKLVPKWGVTMIYDKRSGKHQPYINVKGLLWLAHQESVGLQSVETQVLVHEEDFVMVKAIVRCRRGEYVAHGTWVPRYDGDSRGLEVAETRAVARALRFATGAGTSVEELPREYFQELEKQKG